MNREMVAAGERWQADLDALEAGAVPEPEWVGPPPPEGWVPPSAWNPPFEVRIYPPPTIEQMLADHRYIVAALAERSREHQLRAHPLGSLGAAAGIVSSALGGILVSVVAVTLVAGEWSGRTIGWLFVQEGRRWRVLLAQVVALWLLALACIAVAWAVLGVLGPVLDSGARHLVPAPDWQEAAAFALPMLAKGAAVLAFHVVVAAAASTLARSVAGALGLVAAFWLLGSLAMNLPDHAHLSPVAWIASAAGFLPGGGGFLYLWPGTQADLPSAGDGAASLLALALALLGASALSLRRADITQ